MHLLGNFKFCLFQTIDIKLKRPTGAFLQSAYRALPPPPSFYFPMLNSRLSPYPAGPLPEIKNIVRDISGVSGFHRLLCNGQAFLVSRFYLHKAFIPIGKSL